MQYPSNLRIIRVMCSGMVGPDLVVRALSKGADGVIVLGCHLGECHYLEGNYKTNARSGVIDVVLENCGIDPARFRAKWVSSAEAPKFVEAVTEFIQDIKNLGPNPLKEMKAKAA
jgi:F420-non-reducing hydrogenase iron-sulfur subunit